MNQTAWFGIMQAPEKDHESLNVIHKQDKLKHESWVLTLTAYKCNHSQG